MAQGDEKASEKRPEARPIQAGGGRAPAPRRRNPVHTEKQRRP
jgi:hypothetical protein